MWHQDCLRHWYAPAGRHGLDRCAPLKNGSHLGSTGYRIKGGELVVTLKDGSTSKLADKAQFIGFQVEAKDPSSVLLQHNAITTPSHRHHHQPHHCHQQERYGIQGNGCISNHQPPRTPLGA